MEPVANPPHRGGLPFKVIVICVMAVGWIANDRKNVNKAGR